MNAKLLPTDRHSVFRLAPGLLLIFKRRGHHEAMHAHPNRQRLRVLCGLLVVHTSRRTYRLGANDPPLILAAGRTHETRAVRDTWQVAERNPIGKGR